MGYLRVVAQLVAPGEELRPMEPAEAATSDTSTSDSAVLLPPSVAQEVRTLR